jgi:hypothetical protein
MHQSVLKTLPKRRDRQVEFEVLEEQAERRSYRAAAPKARKFHLRDESPRAERSERHAGER